MRKAKERVERKDEEHEQVKMSEHDSLSCTTAEREQEEDSEEETLNNKSDQPPIKNNDLPINRAEDQIDQPGFGLYNKRARPFRALALEPREDQKQEAQNKRHKRMWLSPDHNSV